MKKQLLLAAAAIAAIGYGCSSEEVANSHIVKGSDHIVASMESGNTRTTLKLGETTQVLWERSDQISVFYNNNGEVTNSQYTLDSGEGSTTAFFSGWDSAGDKITALYPYNSSAIYDVTTNQFSLTIDGTAYTYDSANPDNLNGAIMAGIVDANNHIDFKNAGAIIDLTLKDVSAKYTSATLISRAYPGESSAASYIAGPATITLNSDNTPTLTINDGDGASTTATATFDAADEGSTRDVRLIFPLPVATYDQFVLTLNGKDESKLAVSTWNDVSAKRSKRLYSTRTVVFVNGIPQLVDDMNIGQDEESGLVTNIQTEYDNVTFDYMAKTEDGKNIIKMTIDGDDETYILEMEKGDNGFINHCKETYKSGKTDTWDFTYDSEGYLIKMVRSESSETTTITYENGDIVRTVMLSEDEEPAKSYEHIIDYTNDTVTTPIENKGCIMLYDQTFGVDLDEMRYAYYAGLLGKATKHLPLKLTWVSDNDIDNFIWTLDASNFPASLSINGRGDPFYFTW
jgi:hypothetical protein